MINAALAMEGGALRGMFTAGVVDVLMENDIYLEYTSGISAGSLAGLDYVSKQPGRTAEVNLKHINDKEYCGLYSLVKHRMIFNFDYLFGDISHNLIPFDYDEFENNEMRFSCAATNVRTGEAVFFEKGRCTDIYSGARASSSLALFSRMVEIDGEKYLDGGYSMPIPYQKCFDEGYDKVIIITTRPKGYRKLPVAGRMKRAYMSVYRNYPELVKALINTPRVYNAQMREIEKLEAAGKVLVIRPEKPIDLGSVERDVDKLDKLTKEGIRVGRKNLERIKEYLCI
ncbi:MAG: patatin family protein [Clostridia bacterium]|nr:patatin family protein [Clostridia bacterium]